MKIGKQIRERGKIRFSEYFKELKEGEIVGVVNEASIPFSFSKRIIGKTGKIVGSKGKYKLVQLMDGNKEKEYIIHPIHLKKLNTSKAKEKKR
jgi:large subunit ribosomal protein L21e